MGKKLKLNVDYLNNNNKRRLNTLSDYGEYVLKHEQTIKPADITIQLVVIVFGTTYMTVNNPKRLCYHYLIKSCYARLHRLQL